jgi:ADP-ribose pyrophosphatase YjhB (NUDIX family)
MDYPNVEAAVEVRKQELLAIVRDVRRDDAAELSRRARAFAHYVYWAGALDAMKGTGTSQEREAMLTPDPSVIDAIAQTTLRRIQQTFDADERSPRN